MYLDLFQAYWRHLFLALQDVSGCRTLLQKPVVNGYLWFPRQWVAIMLCCILNFLITSALGCQDVSGWYASFHLEPANHMCSWSSRKWVADVSCYVCFFTSAGTYTLFSREWVVGICHCVLSLQVTTTFCSPVCKWLMCLAVFQAHLWRLSFAD